MTERKPAGMPFTSWIDQQISDAAERGAFDNLAGAGKPLPPGRGEFDGQAWAADWVRREGGSPQDCLPAPLRLRREIERLTEDAPGLRSEQEVRDRAGELNERILKWRRLPVDGPPIFVPLADADAMVRLWRDGRVEEARSLAALADGLLAQRRFAEAEEPSRQVLSLDPGNAVGHARLGEVLRDLNRPKEARAARREARRLSQ